VRKIELMNDRFQSRINPSKNVESRSNVFSKASLSAKMVNTKYEKLFFLVFVSKEQGRREKEIGV